MREQLRPQWTKPPGQTSPSSLHQPSPTGQKADTFNRLAGAPILKGAREGVLMDDILGDDLTRFSAYGSGLDLLRSYLSQRQSNAANANHRKQLLESRLPDMGEGISPQEFEAITTELKWLRTLEQLDYVIEDLVYEFENPSPSDKQLGALRKALKVEDGRAKNDVDTAEKKRVVIALWVQAYDAMPSTGYKSESALKKEISKVARISESTALNYLKEFLKAAPWQERWRKEQIFFSKNRKKIPALNKSKANNHKGQKRVRLNFGKKYATR